MQDVLIISGDYLSWARSIMSLSKFQTTVLGGHFMYIAYDYVDFCSKTE